jgi:GNAT superfamily N-acetyltransferase
VKLTFSWEPVARLLEEPNLDEMLRAHWEELSAHKDEMPLDLDPQRLIAYEAQGIYRVWTARDGGTLAGYIGFYVYYPPHHRRSLIAVDDGYYLAPDYRRGWTGLRLWRSALDALAELGVIGVIGHHKLHFMRHRGGIGAIFRRLGFAPTDELWWLTLRGRDVGRERSSEL